MPIVIATVLALGLGLVVWLVLRPPGKRKAGVGALRRELRKLTHDPDVADRLVDAEMKRHPELGEAKILRRVIRRLRAERRR